ncbi:hypothetical protein CYMTET_28526 [Cymbomonas tetramitiformis]|uniref:Uncharacterized protein n=1 Tax=Cymbomonas tetramitiformis TaxID=36881 RepID=A0AAE0FMY1_9CHLO|nr:hypothetical protein CYMTET_28526 [Cymbomonas tetramitiformis]
MAAGMLPGFHGASSLDQSVEVPGRGDWSKQGGAPKEVRWAPGTVATGQGGAITADGTLPAAAPPTAGGMAGGDAFVQFPGRPSSTGLAEGDPRRLLPEMDAAEAGGGLLGPEALAELQSELHAHPGAVTAQVLQWNREQQQQLQQQQLLELQQVHQHQLELQQQQVQQQMMELQRQQLELQQEQQRQQQQQQRQVQHTEELMQWDGVQQQQQQQQQQEEAQLRAPEQPPEQASVPLPGDWLSFEALRQQREARERAEAKGASRPAADPSSGTAAAAAAAAVAATVSSKWAEEHGIAVDEWSARVDRVPPAAEAADGGRAAPGSERGTPGEAASHASGAAGRTVPSSPAAMAAELQPELVGVLREIRDEVIAERPELMMWKDHAELLVQMSETVEETALSLSGTTVDDTDYRLSDMDSILPENTTLHTSHLSSNLSELSPLPSPPESLLMGLSPSPSPPPARSSRRSLSGGVQAPPLDPRQEHAGQQTASGVQPDRLESLARELSMLVGEGGSLDAGGSSSIHPEAGGKADPAVALGTAEPRSAPDTPISMVSSAAGSQAGQRLEDELTHRIEAMCKLVAELTELVDAPMHRRSSAVAGVSAGGSPGAMSDMGSSSSAAAEELQRRVEYAAHMAEQLRVLVGGCDTDMLSARSSISSAASATDSLMSRLAEAARLSDRLSAAVCAAPPGGSSLSETEEQRLLQSMVEVAHVAAELASFTGMPPPKSPVPARSAVHGAQPPGMADGDGDSGGGGSPASSIGSLPTQGVGGAGRAAGTVSSSVAAAAVAAAMVAAPGGLGQAPGEAALMGVQRHMDALDAAGSRLTAALNGNSGKDGAPAGGSPGLEGLAVSLTSLVQDTVQGMGEGVPAMAPEQAPSALAPRGSGRAPDPRASRPPLPRPPAEPRGWGSHAAGTGGGADGSPSSSSSKASTAQERGAPMSQAGAPGGASGGNGGDVGLQGLDELLSSLHSQVDLIDEQLSNTSMNSAGSVSRSVESLAPSSRHSPPASPQGAAGGGHDISSPVPSSRLSSHTSPTSGGVAKPDGAHPHDASNEPASPELALSQSSFRSSASLSGSAAAKLRQSSAQETSPLTESSPRR